MKYKPYLGAAERRQVFEEARKEHEFEVKDYEREQRHRKERGSPARRPNFTYSEDIFITKTGSGLKQEFRLGDALNSGNFTGVAKAATATLWNYNTVEAVLLFSAVLVNLSGIMFESATGSAYSTDRSLLTVLVSLVIFFSVLYYAIVFASELLAALFPKKFLFNFGVYHF